MKFVDDGETCCHCEAIPTTTTEATTPPITTPSTKFICPSNCITPITCDDMVNKWNFYKS